MRAFPRLLLCAACLLVLPAAAPPARLELRYAGNAGVVLSAGGQRVAIDALHREFPRPPFYEHLPAPELAKLEAGLPPFDGLRAHLTTHAHQDHFHAESVRAFLAAQPRAAAVVPREAGAEVCPATPCAVAPRLHVLQAGWGPERELTFDGVRVQVLELPHARGARTQVDNLGYLVTVGGVRVLHLGDAHMEAAAFARFALPQRRIDVALVPYWYLLDDAGWALVRDHVGARHVVAYHVPPVERREVQERLRARDARVRVLTRMGEVLRF